MTLNLSGGNAPGHTPTFDVASPQAQPDLGGRRDLQGAKELSDAPTYVRADAGPPHILHHRSTGPNPQRKPPKLKRTMLRCHIMSKTSQSTLTLPKFVHPLVDERLLLVVVHVFREDSDTYTALLGLSSVC